MSAVTDTEPRRNLSLRSQLVRFMLVGVVSAIVDYGLLVVGMNVAGLDHTMAKAISWVFGTVTAYVLNSRWTFDSGGSRTKYAAVAILYATTFAVQVGTFALIYPPLHATFGVDAAQIVGFVIAQGLATTINFVIQRTLIFRS